jgi:hypothetical protein
MSLVSLLLVSTLANFTCVKGFIDKELTAETKKNIIAQKLS